MITRYIMCEGYCPIPQPHCHLKVSERSKAKKGVKKNFSYVSLMTNNVGYFFIGLVAICFFPFGFIFIDFYLIFNTIYFLFSPSTPLSSSPSYYIINLYFFSFSLSLSHRKKKKKNSTNKKRKSNERTKKNQTK